LLKANDSSFSTGGCVLDESFEKRWNDWLVHAPKSYTASGNRKSPGYSHVITWVSEVWQELGPLLIARSFDKCGIISRNLANYISELRHFVRTNMFVDDVVPIDDQISDQNNELQGDEWDPALEAILDSESDAEGEIEE
jgi:hypothetical protein